MTEIFIALTTYSYFQPYKILGTSVSIYCVFEKYNKKILYYIKIH